VTYPLLATLTSSGNTFPVVEHPTEDPNSLMGKVIKPGYQSHYVLTDNLGMPCSEKVDTNYYDEIVINQESQV
jgi:hypothetical protein